MSRGTAGMDCLGENRRCQEALLLEGEQRFRQVVECAPDAIYVQTRGRFAYVNAAALALFGAGAPDDVLGRPVRERFHPDVREAVGERIRGLKERQENVPAAEEKILRLDGAVVDVEVSAVPFRYGDDNGALVFLRDITERKRADAAVRASEADLARSRQKLRALSAHNEFRLEQERRSIAREIHDELGQLLTALKMECALLRRQYPDDSLLQKKMETMNSLLDSTIGVARHVVSNLRPPALDHGIIPAIEWLAEDFSLRWEVPCRLELDADDILLDDTRATALFRIVQESLTNVARHAEAGEVVVSLQRQGPLLQLRIRDNGRGFDPAVVAKKRGFGLQGMRERAIAFDGTMRICATPGAGTTLTVKIPL
ncbi:MAG TPA: PAS domain-containing sensor histidine kinase [Rhodocyclaceae bacterium]|nr:PAS domain-containing sensor histidine kinase [Rhodocyclaceae bacterium]